MSCLSRVHPPGREGIHRTARWKGDGFGQQEHQLSRAGRSAGVEVREVAGVGGEDHWGRGIEADVCIIEVWQTSHQILSSI